MIRAVLDTNVLASGFANHRGPSALLMAACRRGSFELVASEHILDELAETFESRYFKKRLTRRQRKGALSLRRRIALVTEITTSVTPERGAYPAGTALAEAAAAALLRMMPKIWFWQRPYRPTPLTSSPGTSGSRLRSPNTKGSGFCPRSSFWRFFRRLAEAMVELGGMLGELTQCP